MATQILGGRRILGDTPKVDTTRPGEAAAKALDEGRQPPAPLHGTINDSRAQLPADAGYGVFRANQGPNGTWHWGIDIATPTTTPVVAPERMSIKFVWTDNATAPFVGYGPAGVLALGQSGAYHLLAHLDPSGWSDASRPTKGQTFEKGEGVGFPAPTGSDGLGQAAPHVHWEVRIQPIDDPTTRPYNTLDPIAWIGGVAQPRSDSPGGIPWWVLLLIGYAISQG